MCAQNLLLLGGNTSLIYAYFSKKILQPSLKYIDFNLNLFIQILHPLRVATIVFSQNDCCLSDVYQIVTEIIKQKRSCMYTGRFSIRMSC